MKILRPKTKIKEKSAEKLAVDSIRYMFHLHLPGVPGVVGTPPRILVRFCPAFPDNTKISTISKPANFSIKKCN